MASLLATFSVLKDHVKLKVTQDTIAIDNMGNKKWWHMQRYLLREKEIETLCNFRSLFD